MNINDKIVVVTGGGSGLGAATARRLAKESALVAVLDRSEEAAADVASFAPERMLAVPVDVADEASVEKAFEQVLNRFGTVHGCVSAAGVATAGKTVSRGEPLDMARFKSVIDVNLNGLFDVVRRCAAAMVTNEVDENGERGVIVNVSSGAAWQGQKGQAAYAASKAGVIGLMLPVARDLAPHGIRVVTIAPGLFRTGMSATFTAELVAELEDQVLFPKRMGDPDEFAEFALHLINNRYLNAATYQVDAGARMV
ncbi:SDR family NAD(P)-dependent oxidoreductase [Nocardioides sp. CN2-186]|uniref:SDR family NAD(P)-dependent oxidoreductase n=1 Tax=Nocardioides tweenelious TaxID=3156607 RepID=UPI0032B57593